MGAHSYHRVPPVRCLHGFLSLARFGCAESISERVLPVQRTIKYGQMDRYPRPRKNVGTLASVRGPEKHQMPDYNRGVANIHSSVHVPYSSGLQSHDHHRCSDRAWCRESLWKWSHCWGNGASIQEHLHHHLLLREICWHRSVSHAPRPACHSEVW